jgi:GT2 family glycosyltransferase
VVDCLRTLVSELARLPGLTVAVVDNDSRDGSAERIEAALAAHGFGARGRLVRAERNGGFAYGNNRALAPALAGEWGPPPDYVMLLNPDTLVRPGAIAVLCAFLAAHPEVGIAGSRLEDPDGTQQVSRYRFYSFWSELDSGFQLGLLSRRLARWTVSPPLTTVDHPIDWVAGAAMLIRREVLEQVGLFDEGFFLGWKCWYVPASRVVHLVGRASGVTNTKEPARRRPRYWFESRRRYFVKHHGRLGTLAIDLAWLAGFASWRMRRRLMRKPDEDPPHLIADFVRFGMWTRSAARV